MRTERARARAVAAWLALVAGVVLAYGWILDGYLVGDDFGYVAHFLSFPLTSWPALFVADWSGGLWGVPLPELRPLTALTFMLDARIWHADPAGYYLTNLVLHGICAGLVMLIAAAVINQGWGPALAAGLLFAMHPVQGRALAWITGRVDVLATAGVLLGFYAFLRYRRTVGRGWLLTAWSAFAAGVFAKESALVLPLLAWADDRWSGRPRAAGPAAYAPYAGWAVILAGYVACRLVAIGGLTPTADFLVLAGRVARRVVPYAGAMFLSPRVVTDLVASLQPLALGMTTVLVLAVIIAVAVAWKRTPRGRRPPLVRTAFVMAVVWPLIVMAPLVATYQSFRHLYAATAGFAIGLIALLCHVCGPRHFIPASVLLVGMVTAQALPGRLAWQATHEYSRRIADAVSAVDQRAQPGDVVLLNVPAHHNGRFLWAWASPFALAPPFQPRDIARRLVVLERRGVHHHLDRWPDPATISRLRRPDRPGWLISGEADGTVSVRRFSPDEMQEALRHHDFGGEDAFDRLVERLEGPAS